MKQKSTAFGIKAGLIIAALYVLLLWIKFTFLSYNPFVFYLGGFISYFLIIAALIIAAVQKRNQQGGYAEIKDLFQPIFIAIIFAEIAYLLFTYFYLNYINPTFFQTYEQAMDAFAHKNKMSAEKIQAQVNMVRAQAQSSKDFWGLAKGILARWIVIDSIFGLMIAFLFRKKTPQQLMDMRVLDQKF
ncbi:hypothetical protein DBR32_02455 [Taibaiella sp. KBW10]|uniref:DUF4199 domain-containing protein n=1 Tax=Taibaiella sp. KBW10 TaxID=2153357 RepID=UPI000F597982|nr:DUF4199 domain-containing protein [Taibaiella sp. KBW10]RQO32483.1 hypothetical protein DBR32_02455 [Taibaiella sp. KBW10]